MDAEPRQGADVAGPETDPSDAELRRAIRGRDTGIDGVDAVHELARRQPRQWSGLLREVVREPERPPEVRGAAAVELGHQRTDANEAALLDALDDGDPSVTRRAADSLGRIGGPAALERLEEVHETGPAGTTVELSRTLIAYRLGREEHRLSTPSADEIVEALPEHPVAVEHDAASEVERRLAELQPEIPALPLSAAGATELSCRGGGQFLVLFTEQAHRGPALGAFEERSGVLAVVFEWFASLERYGLAEYLLTHPTRDSGLRLFGVRPTGTLAHVGDLRLAEDSARFSVRGLDRPHSPLVLLDGTIDRTSLQVAFEQALADPHAPARAAPDLPVGDVDG